MDNSHRMLACANKFRALTGCLDIRPALGLVWGSGLSAATHDSIDIMAKIPFGALPGFPLPGISSHEGNFILGKVGGIDIIIQAGRFHLYEGRTPDEICQGIRLMAALGVNTVLLTNASGALNPIFEVGELMLMSDFINHSGRSPLTGLPRFEGEEIFIDMSAPFDPTLSELIRQSAMKLSILLREGVYIGVHGPELETRAETRMYRQWGADAIGMSTVLEIIMARQLGLRVGGISCLTNKNLPDCMQPTSFEEILHVAERASCKVLKIVHELCREPQFSKLLYT